jgi:cbb3-type cytochrome oxidase subunit 1
MQLMEFLTILLMTLGLFLVLAGVFTAYFGSGKSRTIGVVLLVVGLLIAIIWVGLRLMDPTSTGFIDVSIIDTIWVAFLYILAALIGALIAIGVFLLAIMKS